MKLKGCWIPGQSRQCVRQRRCRGWTEDEIISNKRVKRVYKHDNIVETQSRQRRQFKRAGWIPKPNPFDLLFLRRTTCH